MKKVNLDCKFDDSVARIIFDDGRGNIFDHIMMAELATILNSFRKQNDLKLITFEGAGENFSLGANMEEYTKEKAAEMLYSFHKIFYALMNLHIPTLAMISGQCMGSGFEIPLMCNFIFADKTAQFGQPEILIGLFPPPASIILPLKIGHLKAEELLITGKIIDVEEAKTLGLINEVYEDKETMETEVNKWINKNILGKSASSLRYAVKAARASFDYFMYKNLPLFTDLYVNELMETEDANEGVNSFIEKRKPIWKNC